MKGILGGSHFYQQSTYDIRFKTNGPYEKDWIYGHWFDEDTLQRCVGYREGGQWISLPFSVNVQSKARDIVKYGDTLYIGGIFQEIVLDKTGDTIPLQRGWTPIIKYYNDSIWVSDAEIYFLMDMAVSGDSLLMWTSGYKMPSGQVSGSHIISTNGVTWDNAFPTHHPTGGNFGAQVGLEFKDGDIYSLNNYDSFKDGVVKWDGQQWHFYGNGIYGQNSLVSDFEFYRDEMYMAGSFNENASNLNPGDFIVRWDGTQWQEVGGGLSYAVADLFVANDKLYCQIVEYGFGDANIYYLAAWDGHQWCGTPINYSGAHPLSFGVVNDTLYAAWKFLPTTANGQPLSYMNYFDGDYVNGNNALCSTLGMEKNEIIPQSLEIYPNPAGNLIQINTTDDYSIKHLTINDLSGKIVIEKDYSTSFNSISLDVSSLISGMYLVRVFSEKGILTEEIKIVK